MVRLKTAIEARAVVALYRSFGRRCVGNVHTDDGEGGRVLLLNRAWRPRQLGDESAGMLVGWRSYGSTDWSRTIAVRVGRTVSVVDVNFGDIRPPRRSVVRLARRGAAKLS